MIELCDGERQRIDNELERRHGRLQRQLSDARLPLRVVAIASFLSEHFREKSEQNSSSLLENIVDSSTQIRHDHELGRSMGWVGLG